MRIAYILSPYCYFSNVFSGVVVQARCWANALADLGHEVEFVHADTPINWASFDIVHLFQHGSWCDTLFEEFARRAMHTVLSPIIDPPRPYGTLAALLSSVPFERFRLQQNQRLLRKYGRKCSRFLVRSSIERRSLEVVGVPSEKIVNVPISLSANRSVDPTFLATSKRRPSVLHVSHLAQPRKNVRLLIEVAIENNFELRLAGSLSDPDFAAWLKTIEARYPNVVYLGRISDAELYEEMLSCSVFCLPSLYEGVGIVALDAGYFGANLVVTTAGGTRDYLGRHASYVNPHDREALGKAIMQAFTLPLPNLDAHHHIATEFSERACGLKLEAAYNDMRR